MSIEKYNYLKEIIATFPYDESSSRYSPGVSAIFTIILQDTETIMDFTNSFILNTNKEDIKQTLDKLNIRHIFENSQSRYIIINGPEYKVICQDIHR